MKATTTCITYSINNLRAGIISIFVLIAIGCNKTLDINDNPNEPVSTSNDLLLSGSLLTSLRIETTSFNELGCLWTGYWGRANDIAVTAFGSATSSFEEAIIYTIVDNLYNELWETSYTIINNLYLLQQQAQAEQPVYAGIAKIVQGMHFLQLVDYYNNVPFSQAHDTHHIRPAYDPGASVYTGAIDLISEGINDIENAPTVSAKPAHSDILFKGNLSSWVQLGNTLKLRALLHQSQLAGQQVYIQAEIAKIVADRHGFLTTDALMNPGFAVALNQQAPFWDSYYRDYAGNETDRFRAVRPTRYLLAAYDSLHDPRKEQIYAPATNGSGYAGVLLGQQGNDPAQNSLATSAFLGGTAGLLKSATAPAIYFSAAESYFLQAEAAYRGWLNGSAKDLYESGIRASFLYLGLSPTDVAAYLLQPTVNFEAPSGTSPLQLIIFQKWLASNAIDGSEAWDDFRRLRLPAGIPGSLAASPDGSVHPNRLRYPTSEINTNSAEVARQGSIDPFASKIFWQP